MFGWNDITLLSIIKLHNTWPKIKVLTLYNSSKLYMVTIGSKIIWKESGRKTHGSIWSKFWKDDHDFKMTRWPITALPFRKLKRRGWPGIQNIQVNYTVLPLLNIWKESQKLLQKSSQYRQLLLHDSLLLTLFLNTCLFRDFIKWLYIK